MLVSGASAAAGGEAVDRCQHPVLVLSAMPLELNPLFAIAKPTQPPVAAGGHTFYRGVLAGVPVVMVLTGIGPANARQTATAAFRQFRCSFSAVMFSGVAGTVYNIGDVMIPSRWTLDSGRTWIGVDPQMAAIATRLDGRGHVRLNRSVPTGDAACLCGGVDAPTPLTLPIVPRVRVGGSGTTSDPFGGRAVPCVFGGGDIAGCEPCVLTGNPAQDSTNFAGKAAPLVSAGFLRALTAQGSGTTTMAAVDEETGAVDEVAHRYGVPFIGIRAASDGQGDPLPDPGFPFSFVIYRQLAGDNAAATAVAFLRAWDSAGRPTANHAAGRVRARRAS